MERQELLQELRKIRSVAMATVDAKGNPRNRIIDVMLADEDTIYFCTAKGKAFYAELMEQKKIAIVGMNASWQMIRLHGTIARMENQTQWIDRIFAQNSQMNQVYPNDTRYILEAFCVKDGTLEWFDLGKEPIQRYYVPMIDQEKADVYGFTITDRCIGCGICLTQCPQHCIDIGEPYHIQQEHCLHCGSCFIACPQQAIEHRSNKHTV